MNTKVIIRILLGVAVIFMAYICVNSVVTPIQFEEARVQREVKVINNLVSLRTAEAQFRLDKGYFTADLDSLVAYLKVTPKKEVYKATIFWSSIPSLFQLFKSFFIWTVNKWIKVSFSSPASISIAFLIIPSRKRP